MGNLRHAEFCKCANCVETPPSIDCDDTPRLIDGIVCTPDYIYLDEDNKAWVSYIREDASSDDMKLWSWGTYPYYQGEKADD